MKSDKLLKRAIAIVAAINVILITAGFVQRAIDSWAKSNKKLPIYCVQTNEKKVALSFDAAWNNTDTASLLNTLEKNNVRASFFLVGGWAERYPEDVKKIAEAGHDIGNHSESHKHMSKLSKEDCVQEIMKQHDRIKQICGIEMNLFRPPYGDYNNTLIEATDETGYYCIQWDVDSLDTKKKQHKTASFLGFPLNLPYRF